MGPGSRERSAGMTVDVEGALHGEDRGGHHPEVGCHGLRRGKREFMVCATAPPSSSRKRQRRHPGPIDRKQPIKRTRTIAHAMGPG